MIELPESDPFAVVRRDPDKEAERVLEWIREATVLGASDPGPAKEPVVRDSESDTVRRRLRLGSATHQVLNKAPIRIAASLDSALRGTGQARHELVRRQPSPGDDVLFEVFKWGPNRRLAAPSVLEVETGPDVVSIAMNCGERVYVRSGPAEPEGRRWVSIPGLLEFLALPEVEVRQQRLRWIRQLSGAGARRALSRFETLSTPELRVRVANHNSELPTFRSVRRRSSPGGVCLIQGSTIPALSYPLREPECYLTLLAQRGERLESVVMRNNCLELGPAHLSAGSEGFFSFLWQVWVNDSRLFERELGGPPLCWSMEADNDHVDLVSGSSPAMVLHGRDTQTDIARNTRYLNSATVDGSGSNLKFRDLLARKVSNLLAWPHVQEWLIDASSSSLNGALKTIETGGGLWPIDPSDPELDLFAVKSILISLFVHFPDCVEPALNRLGQLPSSEDKLAGWRHALEGMLQNHPAVKTRLLKDHAQAVRLHHSLQWIRSAGAKGSK